MCFHLDIGLRCILRLSENESLLERHDFEPAVADGAAVAGGAVAPVAALRQFDRYVLHRLVRYAAAVEEGCGTPRARGRIRVRGTWTALHLLTQPPPHPTDPKPEPHLAPRCRYDTLAFHRVMAAAATLCSDDLSAHYLASAKDRLYCLQRDDPSRRAVQAVLHAALDTLSLSVAPVLPFLAEEV